MVRVYARLTPPLAGGPGKGKYKESFICTALLPLSLFPIVGRPAILGEFHVTNVGAPPTQSRAGTVDEAIANGLRLLERYPGHALQQAEALLDVTPDHRAFELAGAALRRLERNAEAEQAELAGIRASFSIPQLDEAAVAGQEGSGAESRAILEGFLSRQPANLLALTMAAELDVDEWRLETAEVRLRTVLERAPSFLRAIMLLGRCLSAQARLSEAIAVYEGVVERKPDNATALRALAQALSEANRHDESADAYKRLLDLDPTQLDLWIIYAQELRMMGRKAES